jgi:phosphohistidine phosphatase
VVVLGGVRVNGNAVAVRMMRRLVLMRHAKSDWSTDLPDHERPLNERGRRDAPAAGAWLAEHAGEPELVLCSTATRTRQTWALASAELGANPAVRFEDRLYDATTGDLLTLVQELPDGTRAVAMVGHNPGTERLATLLTGQQLLFRTSTLAVLTWDGEWADAGPGTARLQAQATPRG